MALGIRLPACSLHGLDSGALAFEHACLTNGICALCCRFKTFIATCHHDITRTAQNRRTWISLLVGGTWPNQ